MDNQSNPEEWEWIQSISPHNNYNPTSRERICCVELINNNLIYIRYKANWTVENLIAEVLKNKEVQSIYSARSWMNNSYSSLPLFDLHLMLYRLIKPDEENKISLDTNIETLFSWGLLKNDKFPFFFLKASTTPIAYTPKKQVKIRMLKNIWSTNNLYSQYITYWPRVGYLNIINSHPRLLEYFLRNKRGLNCFNKIKVNPIVTGSDNLDWLIYDDISVKFLLEMDKIAIDVKAKIQLINNKLYFEDKWEWTESSKKSNNELDKCFVNVAYVVNIGGQKHNDLVTKKIKINEKTTALYWLEYMNRKVELMKSEFKFEPRTKILKVKGLNDYIFDIEEPLINYSYLQECIQENKSAEFYIIDNPWLTPSRNEKKTEIVNLSNMNTSNTPNTPNTPNIADDTNDNDNNNNNLNNELRRATPITSLTNEQEEQLADMTNISENVLNIATYTSNDINDEDNSVKIMRDDKRECRYEEDNKKKDKLALFIEDVNKEIINQIKTQYEELVNLQDNNIENIDSITKDIKNNDDHNVSTGAQSPTTKNDLCIDSSVNLASFWNMTRKSRYSGVKKRRMPSPPTPNIFKEGNKETINFKHLSELYSNAINIRDINLPFSWTIRNCNWTKTYSSSDIDKTSVIFFILQLYSGSQPYSNQKQIKWVNRTGDLSPSFNKRIYFDLSYHALPNYISLIIKIKHIQYNKNNEVMNSTFIGWTNFRWFDHNKKWKTGKHKLSLYNRKFNDDSYYCYTDSNEKDSTNLYFELDSFILPIVNKPPVIKTSSPQNNNFNSLAINQTDMLRINEIMSKTPFDELNNYDKTVLYENRYFVAKIPSMVPRLLLCFNYTNPVHLIEIEKVFQLVQDIAPIQAIEWLGGKYLHESVRKFAVKCLQKASVYEIQNFLLQLVHGWKYEVEHISDLSIFLLRLAVNHPVTIGHNLFWSLRSEMYNQNVQQRFGWFLEIFLNKIGNNLGTIFKNEDFLMKQLVTISQIPKEKNKTKEEIQLKFNDALNELNKSLRRSKQEFSIPLNFKFRIKRIILDKCKVMKSKKKPLWLTFKNADDIGDDIVVMFKKGDDLRMDIVTLQLFKAMQTLWYNEKLKLKMSWYGVICTGDNEGMIEIVKQSVTLAEIQKEEGGAISNFFSKTSLAKWLEDYAICPVYEYTDNFFLSSVAYSIATFVLGIGDRHNDNIMLKTNGEIFHIDFGHFWGHFKYKMGIKRERAPFVFTKQFLNILGGEKDEKFSKFKDLLWWAYNSLRNNLDVLVTLLRILLCTDIPELDEVSIRFLEMSLAVKMNEKDARKYWEEKLNESWNSVMTKVNFAIHIVANK